MRKDSPSHLISGSIMLPKLNYKIFLNVSILIYCTILPSAFTGVIIDRFIGLCYDAS